MRFSYKPYQRKFKTPLQTAHGTWRRREGLLIRIEDEEGQSAFGECAPLPDFGTETLEAASAKLDAFASRVPEADVLAELDAEFPCLRSAFDMALFYLKGEQLPRRHQALRATALLPAGFDAISAMDTFLAAGYRDFKYKVGKGEPVKENAVFLQLMRILPEDSTLRIDANGAFDCDVARHWLRFMEGRRVAWFEQPMPPSGLVDMRLMAQEFTTPIALDESVAQISRLEQLCEQGWRGLFVVKPALLGSLQKFLELRERYQPRIVYSTAFETSVGLQYLIDLAASDPQPQPYPLGLGGENHFKRDRLCLHEFGAQMGVWNFKTQDFEALWNSL